MKGFLALDRSHPFVELYHATPWRISEVTRHHFPQVFRENGFTRGAEIGVWKGAFAKELCEGIPGLHLIAVDPWQALETYRDSKNTPRSQARFDEAYRIARETLAPYDCELWEMTSRDAVAAVPDGSLDFVFIDGDHSEASVLFDLEAWSRKVRKGGVISGHDYVRDPRKPFIEVIDAVDAFVRVHDIRPWFLCETSYLWVNP